jgi:hypothetical protein
MTASGGARPVTASGGGASGARPVTASGGSASGGTGR